MKTNLYNELDTAKDKIRYDGHVKRVLSNRHILARILKRVASEFWSLSEDQIARECLGEDIEIGKTAIYPGKTNEKMIIETVGGAATEQRDSPEENAQLPDMIKGDNTENKIPGEGVVTFDIRLHATIPDGTERIRLIVNLEAQKDPNTKYNIVTRGIFYCARLISAQLDTEFRNSEYDGLLKVYSIWIVMNVPEYIGNAISEYKLMKSDLAGHIPDDRSGYDKLSVIMITLNENCETGDEGLLRMLNVLLSEHMPVDEKARILFEEFHIVMDDDLRKDVKEMCNLSEAIEEHGIEKGLERGRISCEINIIRHGLDKGLTARMISEWMGRDMDYISLIESLIDCYPDASDVELAQRFLVN